MQKNINEAYFIYQWLTNADLTRIFMFNNIF